MSLANRAFALGPWPVSGDRGITRVAGPQPGPVGVADGDPSSLVLLTPVYLVSWLRRSSPARNLVVPFQAEAQASEPSSCRGWGSFLLGAAGRRSNWSLGYRGGSETEDENIEPHKVSFARVRAS